ncbi:LLM class flavin-dependent oxidoreductase [Pseudonocardia sp. RS010]|uniref:LLM class flavin-dependent oxidoreductase n=1 Tax=Pseudonocardia sp. RS010 TaxID=3385979 RepID=UPI00399F1FC5
MKFGAFHPPYHIPTGRNPQLLLQRDVELTQRYDDLGFDEIWFGEHHSCGTELISDPLVFIPYVAPQTKRIQLCTGVVSLPYHNPLWVADRIALIDQLTHGRLTVGVGPGVLTTDAHMIGLDQTTQREALAEDFEVLLALLRGAEPVTVSTARYTLNEARLQMLPSTELEFAVAATASPAGPRLAGRHGASLLSIGATMARHSAGGENALAKMWEIYEERCAEFGNTADRGTWRLVGPMHIAETRELAREQARHGIDAWFDYFVHTNSATHFSVAGETTDERIEWVVESGLGVIGTPEDAIEQINALVEQSGGFGTYLMMTHEWANWPDTLHSLDLFAEYVMPRFTGSADPLVRSERWAQERRGELAGGQEANVKKAFADYEAAKAARDADRA